MTKFSNNILYDSGFISCAFIVNDPSLSQQEENNNLF